MSNIQKAFKNKAKMGLRMASGGFVSSVPDAMPTSMFSGPGGGVGTTYSGSSSPLRQNQRLSGSGGGGGAIDTPLATQPVGRPPSPLQSMNNTIANGAALEGLSNTERSQLGMSGTSAEVSELRQRNEVMRTLRSNLAAQPEMMANGGIVGLLSNRKNVIDEATGETPSAAPAPTPAPKPSAGSQADDYAAQAAAIEAEQLAAARKAAAPAPKKGLMPRLGFAKSGVVQGEGTRTSDSVPATVGEGAGKQKLALSDGEGLLVVSNNTMDNPQAMDQIRQILAASNGGKEPVMPDQGLRGGVKKAAAGAVFAPTEDALATEKLASESLAASRGVQVAPPHVPGDPQRQAPLSGLRQQQPVQQQPVQQGAPLSGSTLTADGAGGRGLGRRVLGTGSQTPESAETSRDSSGGLRMGWASANNAANDSIAQKVVQADGEGVASMRQRDGTFKNVALGASPTRWEDGQQYKDAIAQNEKDKVTLRDMQRDRILRTAAMPGATDGDRLAYAGQLEQDKTDALRAKNVNDAALHTAELGLRRGDQDLRREEFGMINANRDADNKRADAAARTLRDKNTRDEVGEHLKTEAMGEDGKVNGPKLAFLQRAVAQINDPNMDPDLLAQKKLTHAKALSWLDDSGQHWYSIEKAQDGFTLPDLVEEGDNLVDKTTGQSVSKWRLSRAPVDVQRGIYDMIEMQKAARAKKTATN